MSTKRRESPQIPDAAFDEPEPAVLAARIEYCALATGSLAQARTHLERMTHTEQDERLRALCLLTGLAAELAGAAFDSYKRSRWYAGAALVRQLIEVEYLAFRVGVDPTVAGTWLAASPDEVRREFGPQRMRALSEGRFRDAEYWTHCEWGGHPNPGAAYLLDHDWLPIRNRWLWVDLGQHLLRLWRLLINAVPQNLIDTQLIYVDERMTEAGREWFLIDHLADRLPLKVP